ncbi:Npt1/Npt2 family nucleotide transporter [Paenibacillus oryzisoli]|uniref:Npt1/Npt2 family nucleotide transporter n=1 Tax=Paenibacillus oryzisoli TaxID=1850517 RepID=UPI003D2C100A
MSMVVKGKPFQAFLHKWSEDKKEYRKVFLLFAYLFCVVSASTIGRTAADTLFLSRFDNSYLSVMYLPQALVMITAGVLFQRFSPKVRLDTLIKVLIPLISALVLVSRLGVGMELRWVFPVMYIGYDVFNFLMIVCFWQFATSVMDQRKAKQMIGLVGSGGIVGGILSGFGLKALVPLVGTANLIFFYAALQLLAMLAVYVVLRTTRDTAAETKPVQAAAPAVKRANAQKSGLFASVPHLKYVAILAAALVLSLTLIDYQFKVILRGTLQNEALAGFMGSFYGFSGLIALFVQLFVSGKIITRFGVMTALLIFPVVLFAGSLGVLVLPVLAMAVMVKGSDKVVGDTIYSSVSQLVMFPVPPEWRGKAKGFLDGIVRNGAKGLAAICLLLVTRWVAPEDLSYIVLALLLVGIGAGIKVKKAYLSTLLANLKTAQDDTQIELNLMDSVTRQILIDTLGSTDKQQALYAFGLLKEASYDLTPHVRDLLRYSAPEVVMEALAYVEERMPAGFEGDVLPLLHAESPPVQAKALLALSAYADDAYLEEITEHLDAEKVEVQAAAIAGLVKYYGIEGMFRAVGKLKDMMESGREEERMAMASLFGQIRVKNFYKPLRALLEDRSPQVRIRALESAAILHVPPLIDAIVALLRDNQTRRHAVEALAAYDEDVVLPQLAPYLEDLDVRLYMPAVFERMPGEAALDRLFSYYGTASYELRDRIVESLQRMQQLRPHMAVDAKLTETYILQEIQLHGQFAEHGAAIAGDERYAEIVKMVQENRRAMSRRVFQLLSLLHDSQTMQAVYLDWSEGDSRQQANAEEVIDQTLQGTLRTEMAKLMASPRELGKHAASPAERTLHLDWLAEQGDDWLVQSIRHLLLRESGRSGDAELEELMHRVQMLRQVALFQGLTSRDLAAIAVRLHPMEVKQGATVIREGDPGDSLMLLVEGAAGVHRAGAKLGGLKPGDCFGEMAILTQSARTASIVAEADSQLLRLDSAVFYDMMFDQKSIAVEMMKLLSRRLRSELARGKAAQEAAVGAETDGPPAVVQQRILHAASDEAAAGLELMSEETVGVSSAGQKLAEEATAATNTPPSTEREREAAADQAASGAADPADPAGAAGQDVSDLTSNGVILRRILVLQKIDLFAHLAPKDFVWLAQMVEEVAYSPGDMICKAGDFGDSMYGIIEGRIRVHRGSDTFAMLGEGDFFGEMAIIDSGPRSADCTVAEPAVLMRLHRDLVFSFCFQNIDVLRSMMRVIADRLRGMN